MGNKDSKSLPEEKSTPDLDSSESEDESMEVVFPMDPDAEDGDSDVEGLNEQCSQQPSTLRSKLKSPVKKSKQKLSAPVKSFREFLESCNAIPDYNSVATIEYARKFIHDGFSKCSGDDLSACLAMLLEYFYKSFEKINMYRDIFYLIYKDSRYTHFTTRIFSTEFEKVFQQQKSKISENSKWGEIVMFGSLLCELLTIYQADSFLVTKQLSNWSMELIKSAMEGNDNALIAYMLILKRLATCKLPLKERFDHDLGVLKILLRDENGESKTQEIYNYLEQRRLSQLADYECLEESTFAEEVSKSVRCREIEKFLQTDNEKIFLDINLFYDMTDNELEFFARKFIEIGIEKPQKIKFLAFATFKFQNVLNSVRKIINIVVKHLEEEIEAMRIKNPRNGIPIINFSKFIAELYVNERKIISPIMMTSWLSLLMESGQSVAIVSTLSTCGYFYQIDEPENFDKFMNSINIFCSIVDGEMKKISDQLNGKGQEVYVNYHKSRMYKPNPSAAYLDNLELFLYETSRKKTFNFDCQSLLEFRYFDMYNTARSIINKVSRPNADVLKIAEFLKGFFEFSFKIGKLVKKLKINFESRISEMTLDNSNEMKNVGKLIGELRNYTVIDKIPQDKWLEMIESFNGLKNSKVMEIQLEVLKVMLQNFLIHDEDRYIRYLKDISAIDTSDPQITLKTKSLILQITRNTVPKKIDKVSKDLLFKIKIGCKIEGLPLSIPRSSQTEFDLNDFVKVFMIQAISNRFLMGLYTNSIKSLRNGRNNDFFGILLELCKDRFKNLLNPELFDEDEAIGTLKLIRNLFKPSILTAENNEAFLQQMLDFKDFKNHTNCFKILYGMIKSVVIFTETRTQSGSNKNLKALLRQVEIKLTGVDELNDEVKEEVEVWHIVDYQGFTNEKSLLETESIEPSQLAWSFTKNYQEDKGRTSRILEKAKTETPKNSTPSAKPLNLFNQHVGRSQANSAITARQLQNSLKTANRSAFKNVNKSSKGNWNVTRDDLQHRNDLKSQGFRHFSQRADKNSHMYQNQAPNSMNNRNSRQGRSDGTQNWRQNQQSGASRQDGKSSGHDLCENHQKVSQFAQFNRKDTPDSKQALNSHIMNQNSLFRQNTVSGPAYIQNTKTDSSQHVQNSVQNNKTGPKLNVSGVNNQQAQKTNQVDQQAQKTNQPDQKLAIIDNLTQKQSQNVQNSVQTVQKSSEATQKVQNETSIKDNRSNLGQTSKNDPKAFKPDQNLASSSISAIKSASNVNQIDQILQIKDQTLNNPIAKPTEGVQKSRQITATSNVPQETSTPAQSTKIINQSVKDSSQKVQNSLKQATSAQNSKIDKPALQSTTSPLINLNNLSSNPTTADIIATYNGVITQISSNTENFKKCAIFIHGWGLGNKDMQSGMKELTKLIKEELLLNHKQLLVDMAAELSEECDALRIKMQIQQKNIFITTVKAVLPFLVNCAFYNMLDDLLGQINNGNQPALMLFLDLTEGMKEFFAENCRERDQFVPNCVKVLEKATKFKGEESTRKRTFEIYKYFQSLKVNAANNWRDNSNSRMRNAGSTQSVSSSKNSGGNAKKRRAIWFQNNQGLGAAGGNGRGGSSKMGSSQKTGNNTSKNDKPTSKSDSAQKSDNITSISDKLTSKSDNITSKSDSAHKSSNITPTTSANATNSQKPIADPPSNLNIDEKIIYYINHLDTSNIAAIGLKISSFCTKESTKQQVLQALLDKGVSHQKFIDPVIKLFEILFKTNEFEATKTMMADLIGNEFVYVCENKNKNQQILANFAKFIRAFEPFLSSSFMLDLWWELLEFVKIDTPNVLGNLILLMTDRLDLFYKTNEGKQSIQEFVRVFKMKLRNGRDTGLKAKIEKIIKCLENNEVKAMTNNKKDTKPETKTPESHRQVEKTTETPADKTMNLIKLLGVGNDDGDLDLFNRVKSQIQSGSASQIDNMGNICTKFGSKSDKADLKTDKSDQILKVDATKEQNLENDKQKNQKSDNLSQNDQHPGRTNKNQDKVSTQSEINTEFSALIDIQEKLQQIYLQNTPADEKQQISNPESVKVAHSVANKQAKLIQGLTKQIDLLNIEDEASDEEEMTANEQTSRSNHDKAIEDHNPIKPAQIDSDQIKNDSISQTESNLQKQNLQTQYQPSDSTQEHQQESSTSSEPSKKSTSTLPHQDDKIRPIIFTSDYILFDKSVENRRKFAEILKFMCNVSNDNKDSIEIRENIAKALIKLNYLKLQTKLEEFYDYAEIFFQLYTKPEQSSFNKFVMLKFLKAWKFYEQHVDNLDEDKEGQLEKIYDKFSKSVCRIKKSFKVSSDEPMEGNLTSTVGSLTYKSGTGTIPKMSSITSKLNDITSKSDQIQGKSTYFIQFLTYLIHILTSLLTGHVTIKQEYTEEAVKTRRPGICQLICDLYLNSIVPSDFILEAITKLLEFSKNNPDNFKLLAEIFKNVGALLEIREKDKFNEIFSIILSKIQDNPEKVTEIFELRKNRYANVENFTPVFLLFHENPAKIFGFIETLWKRLMENPEKVAELSEIVEELLEHLDEKFSFLISEFMENRRISFEKIPVEMFSKIVSQRLKGSILFSFKLFEMQILSSERFAGWLKDEVYGKLGHEEKEEISKKLLKCGIEVGENLTENLKEQFEKFNIF